MESQLTLKISTAISIFMTLSTIITSVLVYRNKISKLLEEHKKITSESGTTLVLPEALTNALANSKNSDSSYKKDLNNIYSRINRLQEQNSKDIRALTAKIESLNEKFVPASYCKLIQKMRFHDGD